MVDSTRVCAQSEMHMVNDPAFKHFYSNTIGFFYWSTTDFKALFLKTNFSYFFNNFIIMKKLNVTAVSRMCRRFQ